VTPSPPRARRSWLGGVVLVGVLGFVAFMTTILVTITIWPGEATLTAPLFCDDDMPDAFVVVDRYRIEPGETSYDFSLYCMGPRGQTREIGLVRPSIVLAVAHGVVIALLAVAVMIPLRRARRRSPTVDAAATAEP
jgi:hypothetical protein